MSLPPRRARTALLALALGAIATTAAAAPSEHEVKAAFLVSFTRFVEWPAASGEQRIVVVEPDPFGRVLDANAADPTLPSRMVVQRIPASGSVPSCRMLFVGKGAGAPGLAALTDIDDGVLTVGETEAFLARGGMIRLAVVDGRVRVEINVDAAKRSRLRISSELMRVATLRHEADLR